MIVSIVTLNLIAASDSPLLEHDPDTSLIPVLTLGQVVVSNLVIESTQPSVDILKLSCICKWLIDGLRKEPSVSSLLCSIKLERQLLDETFWMSVNNPQWLSCVMPIVIQTHLDNTMSFVQKNLTLLMNEHFYGKHDKVISMTLRGVLQVLREMSDKQFEQILPSRK